MHYLQQKIILRKKHAIFFHFAHKINSSLKYVCFLFFIISFVLFALTKFIQKIRNKYKVKKIEK